MVQENQAGQKMNGDISLCSVLMTLMYWKKTRMLYTYTNIITEPLSVISKEVYLDINAEKTSIFSCLVNRKQDRLASYGQRINELKCSNI